MDPNSSNSKLNPKIQSFLEALRNNQGRVQGSESPSPIGKSLAEKEQSTQRLQEFHTHRSQEWNHIYNARRKSEQARIAELTDKITQITARIQQNTTNIDKSVQTTTQSRGSYQITFLEHLLDMVQIMFQQSQDTNSWLAIYQNRSKKMGKYWSGVKSGGASYLQNHDRSVATSVG
jgi:DNA anti-recombination protein RmuC